MSSPRSSQHERHAALPVQVDELLVSALGPSPAAARVLDCGGGTGRFAVPLAAAGATVTVLDVSADALATLLRRASEAGVADRVRAVQGDVEAVAEVFGGEQFDLVLAHGVLAAVDDVSGVFAGIVGAVRPGGQLSVLVENPVAGVLARALAGDLIGAEREIEALDSGQADRVAGPDTVLHLCAENGLSVDEQHGLGIFRDLVPGQALDQPGARDALARLEAACAQRSPFAQIAARVHILARRTSEA